MNRNRGKFGKSPTDRMLTGLCGGIADYSGISSSIVRVVFMAMLFFTRGYGIWIYFILAAIVPVAEAPAESKPAGETDSTGDWKRQWQRQRQEGTPEGEIAPDADLDGESKPAGAGCSEDDFFKDSHKKKSDWS